MNHIITLRILLVGVVLSFPVCLAAQEKDKADETDDRARLGAHAPAQVVDALPPDVPEAKLKLTSDAFRDGEVIPTRHSCEGDDLSPPLSWSNVPDGTRAFALICEDPDAPVGTWDHWVIFNLPGELTSLPEGVTAEADLGEGVGRGLNSWQRTGYGGPCPPPGKPHRYFFRLYALAATVDLSDGATKQELLEAIKPLTLGHTELMGTFSR